MQKFPILSICIPTYNRSACLRECLESVLFSAKGYEERIEIVVSDNASTDETITVVNEFKKRCPRSRYHRNDTNFGAERNCYIAAGLASGEYIWILGDDDKIRGEAISSVLSRIKSRYNLIVSNYSIWSRDFSVMKKQRGLSIRRDEDFNNPNELMKCFGLHLGYISSVIIRKDVFLSAPPAEYECFIEYGFPHLYSVYTGITKNCHAAYISTPLVCNRSGNSPMSVSGWYKFFVTGSSLVFEALLTKGYTQNAVHSAKHQVLKSYVIPDIVVKRSVGDTDVKIASGLLFPHYKKDWLFWAVCVPVLYVPAPAFLVRFAIKIARAVRKR